MLPQNIRHSALAVFLLLFSASANATADKIYFKVNFHETQKVIRFTYTDFFGDIHDLVFRTDDKKKYPYPISSTHPIVLTESSSSQTIYIVYPGDSLEIKQDANGRITIEDIKTPLRSQQLGFFTNPVLDYSPLKHYITMLRKIDKERKTATDWLAGMQQLHQQRINILRHSKSCDPDDHCSRYLSYIHLMELLLPLQSKRYAKENLPVAYVSTVTQTASQLFTCDTCLNNELYRSALISYTQLLYRAAPGGAAQTFDAQYAIACEQLKGSNRQYIQFILLRNSMDQLHGNNAYRRQLNEFYTANPTEKMTAYLQENISVYDVRQNNIGNNARLLDQEGNIITWQQVQQSLKGKIIYVDFWASWCAPCRQEFIQARKLKAEYGQEVAFVYISKDKNKNQWLNAVADEEMMSYKNNYLLLDPENSQLNNTYKITTIPRYLLFGKAGELVLAEAPRPGDASLISHFNKLYSSPTTNAGY